MRGISTFTATSAPTARALTTLAAVKADLGVTGTDSDAQLTELILQASDMIADTVGARRTEAGDFGLGRGTYQEVFRLNARTWPFLLLAQWPAVPGSLSVVLDGTGLIEGVDFEVRCASGIVYRLAGSGLTDWRGDAVTIGYEAGWILPDQATVDAPRTLPTPLELAARVCCRHHWAGLLRDLTIRRETVPDTYSVEYSEDAMRAATALADAVEALVRRYRRQVLR